MRKALVVNVVALGGLVLFAIGILAVTAVPPKQAPSVGRRLTPPPSLGGLRLMEAVGGESALEEINRLHGRPIFSGPAVIARFGGDAGVATLWIAQSRSPLQATLLLWRMNRRMRGGTQVFSPPRQREAKGRTVFTTQGLGQRHFYYQSGDLLLWLAVPQDEAEKALEDLLKRFP